MLSSHIEVVLSAIEADRQCVNGGKGPLARIKWTNACVFSRKLKVRVVARQWSFADVQEKLSLERHASEARLQNFILDVQFPAQPKMTLGPVPVTIRQPVHFALIYLWGI